MLAYQFHYSIPFLKENMIEQYLLEVLQENSAAISVYQKLGFSITREFNYYHQPINEILFSSSNISNRYLRSLKSHPER